MSFDDTRPFETSSASTRDYGVRPYHGQTTHLIRQPPSFSIFEILLGCFLILCLCLTICVIAWTVAGDPLSRFPETWYLRHNKSTISSPLGSENLTPPTGNKSMDPVQSQTGEDYDTTSIRFLTGPRSWNQYSQPVSSLTQTSTTGPLTPKEVTNAAYHRTSHQQS